MRVYGQPGFILHRHTYKESSLLLEVFSRDYGRVGLVAKGARRASSRYRAELRPFQPLLLGWSGKGELATLTGVEMDGPFIAIDGEALYCGYYMNELLLRLLRRHDPHEALYRVYKNGVTFLGDGRLVEWMLRLFEKYLLSEVGYGPVLTQDIATQSPIEPAASYDYVLDRGPMLADVNAPVPAGTIRLRGQSLLTLANETPPQTTCLVEIKKLMRALIGQHLEGKPLQTRRLMQSMRTKTAGAEVHEAIHD